MEIGHFIRDKFPSASGETQRYTPASIVCLNVVAGIQLDTTTSRSRSSEITRTRKIEAYKYDTRVTLQERKAIPNEVLQRNPAAGCSHDDKLVVLTKVCCKDLYSVYTIVTSIA